ncbi:response regulator [Roseburia sp. 499]|uniref:response regulator n=1 Tax=Roseburia sp. 499 TaxID=1261634 RepID=UPI000950EC60|nr:response regulator [Roseburia sp. 499]WVK71038.1 response regulator [Roseburia sp. 499]
MENVRPNVLIVDDDIQALETMSLYLEDMAEVFTVTGGRQAIEFVQQHHMDVILLDVDMPGMNGFKTLEQFRNLKECINVPVVLVTGKRDKYTVMNSVVMGVDGYLVKPVDKESLSRKVTEVFEKKSSKENQKTILAIDDDMSYLKIIDSYLRDNYNVIMINSAKLALDYLIKHTPDLILLDYQMPLYNGANVMNMIQRDPEGAQIPVIILSGVMDIEVLKQCFPCNPAACLAKPVSKEVLIETIENALK